MIMNELKIRLLTKWINRIALPTYAIYALMYRLQMDTFVDEYWEEVKQMRAENPKCETFFEYLKWKFPEV